MAITVCAETVREALLENSWGKFSGVSEPAAVSVTKNVITSHCTEATRRCAPMARPIAYVKNMKTGGTTIEGVLRHIAEVQGRTAPIPKKGEADFSEMYLRKTFAILAAYGEAPGLLPNHIVRRKLDLGIPNKWATEALWLTSVRAPEGYLKSAWLHGQRSTGPGFCSVGYESFSDAIERCSGFHNPQFQYVAPGGVRTVAEVVNAYDFMLVTEHMDESLVALTFLGLDVNIGDLVYVSSNVAPKMQQAGLAPRWQWNVSQINHEQVSLDRALWNAANKKLAALRSVNEPAFSRRLKAFKKLNAAATAACSTNKDHETCLRRDPTGVCVRKANACLNRFLSSTPHHSADVHHAHDAVRPDARAFSESICRRINSTHKHKFWKCRHARVQQCDLWAASVSRAEFDLAKSPRVVPEPNPKWGNYRLSDFIAGIQSSLAPQWPSSIAAEYLKRTDRVYTKGTRYPKNYTLLNAIIRERSRNSTQHVPPPAAVVVHLRLGDTLDSPVIHGGPNFQYNRTIDEVWGNTYPDNYTGNKKLTGLRYFEKLIPTIPRGWPIVLVGSIVHINRKGANATHQPRSRAYQKRVTQYFLDENMHVIPRWNHDPDNDFLFMANSKFFVPGGGGFSAMISKIVEQNGGCCFRNHKY